MMIRGWPFKSMRKSQRQIPFPDECSHTASKQPLDTIGTTCMDKLHTYKQTLYKKTTTKSSSPSYIPETTADAGKEWDRNVFGLSGVHQARPFDVDDNNNNGGLWLLA